MIPMENRDAFFPQNYKMYGKAKGLICRGDGETATRIDPQSTVQLKDEETGKVVKHRTPELSVIECAGKNCEYFREGKKIDGHMYRCNTIGNLQVILPKIKGLGIYQIDTSSYNSIVNINSCIAMIRGMPGMGGRISWIPLILEVNMQEAHPTVKGKKIITNIPVMTITADVTPEELLQKSLLSASPLAHPTVEQIKEIAEIDNPEREDKPELLYAETDQEKDENKIERIKAKEKEAQEEKEKKAGETETSAEEEKKEKIKAGDDEGIPQDVQLRQEIEGLFDQLGWPVGRRVIWQRRDDYDACQSIEGLQKLRNDLKERIQIEADRQDNLFKKKEEE